MAPFLKIISAVLIALLLPTIARGADPSVRSAINKDGNSPGLNAAFAAFATDPVTGDAIVVMTTRAAGIGTPVPAPPTDSQSNTYTQVGTEQCGTWNASICISMWIAYNITGGSAFVVTVHWTVVGPTWYGQVAYNLMDVKTTATPYNGDFAKAAAAAATSASVSTIVAPAANSLALAGVSTNCPNNNIVNGTGWVTPAGGSMTSNNNQDLYGETKTVSATYTADWTSNSCAHTQLTASFSGPSVATGFALTLAP